MAETIALKVRKKFVDQYRNGYPLIESYALEKTNIKIKEGEIIHLVDEKGKFLGKGYYGIQNKGIGWILSNDIHEKIDMYFFEKRLKEAFEKRAVFFKNTKTTAFRLFNGEGDGIGGLTIDYFDGYYLINWYSRGVFKYRDYVLNNLKSMVQFKGIYQKRRYNSDGKFIEEDSFVMGTPAEFPLIVQENNVNFAVYLNEGAMVGFFMDQRDVRKRIRDHYAAGKTVLNTFSYTGAFSVFAALGDAQKTTSVDLANRSLVKTQEQFAINGIDYEQNDIVVQDVFDYFKEAQKKKLQFDMVILDPPSFAKSKKMIFAAEKDYTNLLKDAIAITAEEGLIVASTNCSSFDMKTFMQFIELAFKQSKCSYKILESHALPRDFVVNKNYKEGNYLKVVFIQKGK